ncbi:MAG: DUF3144 domain-containing protein [Gammaproteobacteria bacterium]|nr:DUF3144 domain-containing protein [Gammaproteobacteria bacterium]
MSNRETQLIEAVEKLLDLANELAESSDPDVINAALLHAASRYNAFVVALNTDDLKDEKRSAVSYLVGEYKAMLEEQLDDFIANPVVAEDDD